MFPRKPLGTASAHHSSEGCRHTPARAAQVPLPHSPASLHFSLWLACTSPSCFNRCYFSPFLLPFSAQTISQSCLSLRLHECLGWYRESAACFRDPPVARGFAKLCPCLGQAPGGGMLGMRHFGSLFPKYFCKTQPLFVTHSMLQVSPKGALPIREMEHWKIWGSQSQRTHRLPQHYQTLIPPVATDSCPSCHQGDFRVGCTAARSLHGKEKDSSYPNLHPILSHSTNFTASHPYYPSQSTRPYSHPTLSHSTLSHHIHLVPQHPTHPILPYTFHLTPPILSRSTHPSVSHPTGTSCPTASHLSHHTSTHLILIHPTHRITDL